MKIAKYALRIIDFNILGISELTTCGTMYHGDGEIDTSSSAVCFWGIVSQAFLSLPWFAKVGFLYPPPFPHGRPCSQNGRTILADGT